MESSEETCYICMNGVAEEAFVEPKPCKCKGSINIHVSCLEQVKRVSQICGICKKAYCNPGPDGLITIRRMHRGMIELSKVDIDGHLQGRLKRYTSDRLCDLDIPCFEVNYKDGLPDGQMMEFRIHMRTHGDHWLYVRTIKTLYTFENGQLNGNAYHYYERTDEEINAMFASLVQQYATEQKDYCLTDFAPNPELGVETLNQALPGEIMDPKIMKITPFVNNKKNGTTIKYYESGTVWKTAEYNDGNKEGTVKEYGRNGKLRFQEEYVLGFKEGDEIAYQSDGSTVKSKKIYRGGAFIRVEYSGQRF